MPEFRVTWTIEIDAASPEDAARQALDIQRDRMSTATCFTVARSDTTRRIFVDALAEEPPQPLRVQRRHSRDTGEEYIPGDPRDGTTDPDR